MNASIFMRIGVGATIAFAAWLCHHCWIRCVARTRTPQFPPSHKLTGPSHPTLQAQWKYERPIHSPQRALNKRRTATIVHVTPSDHNSDGLELLLSARVHLVELHLESISRENGTDIDAITSGLFGDFCELNFTGQRHDPTLIPTFRHWIQQSPACAEKRYRVNIQEFHALAHAYDTLEGSTNTNTNTRVLPLGGAIFHESRCGSTFVAHALQVMSPTQHRVYIEAQPGIVLQVCGDDFEYCSKLEAATLLRKVVYLMSRSNKSVMMEGEQRIFFKFQSDYSRHLEIFQIAFPKTPWIFVFRNPVHVLVSQFKEGKSLAKCWREGKNLSAQALQLLHTKGFDKTQLPGVEFVCAAILASYCEAALRAMERAPMEGALVHHSELPSILVDEIFPNHLRLTVSDEQRERILAFASQHSRSTQGVTRPYVDDSEEKERKASNLIREASEVFLDDLYRRLVMQSYAGQKQMNEIPNDAAGEL